MITPYWQDETCRLYLGECLDVLAEMEPGSVDAVVCDPPYALAELPLPVVFEALTAWLGGDRAYIPAGGKGFMGRDWDRFVPPPAAWDECMRVLKPGGHLLAFAAPRTQDLMGMSVRLAGFEIRDGISWLYGSGFPKSLDVSKAIDRARRRDYVLAAVELGLEIPGNNLHDWTKAEHSPGDAWWEKFKAHLAPEDWQRIERAAVGRWESPGRGTRSAEQKYGLVNDAGDITAPATEDAARWDGWGTALKPAHEPLIVARKPLTGTVAANVLEHGTGALNIGGCRVGEGGHDAGPGMRVAGDRRRDEWRTGSATGPHVLADTGRWPPNVLLSEESAAELDQQSGVLTSGSGDRGSTSRTGGLMGAASGRGRQTGYSRESDTGGASRYFPVFRYEAKADAAERPRLADGTAHSTVKPVALMRWLVRLVTPPGGLVVDPFAGTGTTGEACIIEGFRSVLIERDPKYAELAVTRLRKPIQPDLFGGAA
jgi:site-specific DNA-methyltransferase (adenine-specific)